MRFVKKIFRGSGISRNNTQRRQAQRQAIKPVIESLENRVLLSADGPRVTSAVADNRGLTTIFFDQPLLANTVTTSSVQVFTAGPDGILNTHDDVLAPATVIYGAGQQRIIVSASLPVDTAYWVTVKANLVKGANGLSIDGEYTGTFPSGDGTPGGNFRIAANPSSGNRVARFLIGGQALNVVLATAAQLPHGIPDFMFYVNGGKYDNTFIHRSTIANPNDPNNNFSIIQGGGFYVASDPQLGQRGHQFGAQPQEGVFSNVRGTLALANQGFSNTTENQWYFNVTDNSAGFDPRFTVLGQVASANFLPVLDHLDSFTSHLDLSVTSDPINHPNTSRFGPDSIVQQLTQVPVTNPSVDANTVDPARDFIPVTRVAIKQIISAMSAFPAVVVSPSISGVSGVAAMVGSDPVIATPLFATTIPITSAWNSLDPQGNTKNIL